MEFISAEEFLKQPVEVQNVILEWWQPSTHDLVNNVFREVQLIGEIMNPNNPNRFKLNNVINNKKFILLLTEGQLRKFIEDKTEGHVDCAYYAYKDNGYRGYTIELWSYSPYECIKTFKDLGDDLLQAYWKVAIEIAKEEKR